MDSFRSIAELGAIIHKHARQLDPCIMAQQAEKIHPLSTGTPPIVFLPPDLQVVRDELEEAVEELLPRLRGLVPYLMDKAGPRSITAFTAIHAIAELGIPAMLGANEICSIGTMAVRCCGKVGIDDLTRLLRAAISYRVFDEPQHGFISHNASSLALARDPDLQAWMELVSKDLMPAQTCMLDAMRTWPGSGKPEETGWSLANARLCCRAVGDRTGNLEDNAGKMITTAVGGCLDASPRSFFACLGDDTPRTSYFSRAMRVMQRAPAESTAKMVPALCKLLTDESRGPAIVEDQQHASSNGKLPPATGQGEKGDAELLIIDVGGSSGAVCASVLRCIPHARAIVQDVTSWMPSEYGDLLDRISFQKHDFFQQQPEHLARVADVYFLRMILHDWDDERASAILRALVPGLKLRPGSRIIVNALCLLDPKRVGKHNYRRLDKQAFHSYDLLMKGLLNGRERDEGQWRVLIEAADSDLRVKRIVYVEGSIQVLIEIECKA